MLGALLAAAFVLGVGYFSDDIGPGGTTAGTSAGATFTLCGSGPRINCVVDGDTFWLAGEKIRIADIDTPETFQHKCAAELQLGNRATRRLAELLNAGPFTMERIDRDEDRYGRKLRIVVRDGHSLGDVLVSEGLARTWTGRRQPWC